MKLKPVAAALCAGFMWAGSASAADITFDELVAGVTLSTQYAALGVTFTPNAFTGAGTSSSGADWATNTDMTIVSTSGSDVGGLGTPVSGPSLVGGNVLRSFSGWLDEDGDASFAAIFSTPITAFSADFAGVSTPGDVKIYAYAGSTLLGSSSSSVTTGQFTLSFSGTGITRVVVTPGSFNDWVGVDNIRFTQAVPEPESYALMALGMGVLAIARRRSKAAQA